jgi:hypothetical protein
MAEKTREELIKEALLANALSAQGRSINTDVDIAPPVPTEVAPVEDTSPIRSDMASEGKELIGAKVDIPDKMRLYSEDGMEITIPKPVQAVIEALASAGISGFGVAEAGAGYTVGTIADIAVKLGANRSTAERFARDIMAMPEAFAGKLGTLPITKIARGSFPKVKTDKKPEATVKQVDSPEMTDAEIGNLIRTASSKGMGSEKALEKLIAQAKINPEVKKKAEDLGFNLPFDIFTESPIIQQAAGITRDVKGSVASAAFDKEILDATRQADTVIEDLGASSDISLISSKINRSLNDLQIDLDKKAEQLYKQVDKTIKKPEPVELQNTIALLNQIVQDAGIESLSPKLRAILKRKNITYGGLIQLKSDIGQAMKGSGPFKDASSGQLKRVYGSLVEDQLLNASRLGGDEIKETLVKANQLTAKKKALEENIVKAMGKDLEGSLANNLRTSITTASKGDIGKINRTLDIVPEELKKEAILTALNTLSRTPENKFSFSKFRKLFTGMESNKEILNILNKNLGADSVKILSDLNDISTRIVRAQANVSTTGKANQALLNSMMAESIIEKFLSGGMLARATRGGLGGAAGLISGVPYVAPATAAIFQAIKVAPKERLNMAGELFNSVQFRNLIDNVSEAGQASSEVINNLANSPVYKRWSKTMGIEDPRNWLNTAIVSSAETDAVPAEIQEEVEPINSSSLQNIIESMDQSTKERLIGLT